MKRANKKTPDEFAGMGGSYIVDPKTGKRRLVERTQEAPPLAPDVHWWRELAAYSLPTITFESVDENQSDASTPADRVWTLREDARLTWTWRESDMPRFGAWLYSRLTQLHGALKIASTELGVVKKKRRGGAKTAANRRAAARARDADLIDQARKLLAKNPRLTFTDLARHLSDQGRGGFASLRKKLPKLLK